MTAAVIETLMSALQIAPSNRSLVLFHVGGGAIADVSSAATAFVHRNLQALLQIKAIWTGPEHDEVNRQWVRDTRAAVAAHLTGSYVCVYRNRRLSTR